jgi:4'-phosphopantetheinyl transferase
MINLYYADIKDWDIEWVKGCLKESDFIKLHPIKHKPTLHLKMLNRVLLRYLFIHDHGMDEDQILYDYNDRGKPSLKYFPSLSFNSSYSHDLVVIGIADSCQFGVDIEKIKQRADEDRIVESFFSSEEQACYRERGLVSQHAFYEFWTAKEGVIKALGKGLWEADIVPEVALMNNRFVLKSSQGTILDHWSVAFPSIQKEYVCSLVGNRDNIKVQLSCLSPETVYDSKLRNHE